MKLEARCKISKAYHVINFDAKWGDAISVSIRLKRAK